MVVVRASVATGPGAGRARALSPHIFQIFAGAGRAAGLAKKTAGLNCGRGRPANIKTTKKPPGLLLNFVTFNAFKFHQSLYWFFKYYFALIFIYFFHYLAFFRFIKRFVAFVDVEC